MVIQSMLPPAKSSSTEPDIQVPARFKAFMSKAQYMMIVSTIMRLKDCGFYWNAITGREANMLLMSQSPGTFLIRDSTDRRHLFTLCVKTDSGTKNLRIKCDLETFYLQTDPKLVKSVAKFKCVLQLVSYYTPKSKSKVVTYINADGEKIPLVLLKPYYCNMTSLQHLCRITVNIHEEVASKKDQLPVAVQEFLNNYEASV
ncbi:suppressor of cytokine signaling 3a [Menidia menidia]